MGCGVWSLPQRARRRASEASVKLSEGRRESVQKEGGGAFMPITAAKCVDKKRWKGGNVRIGPENERR